MQKGLTESMEVLTAWGSSVFSEVADILNLALSTILMPINFILAMLQ